jgi:CHRD domain/FG-GAP-like repeat
MKLSRLTLILIGVLMLAGIARAEIFTANLTPAQQVPAAASTATGYGRFFVNTNTMTYTFTVVFNGLTSAQTLSHIHAPAPIGANASVIINFGTVGGTSGTITGSGSITQGQLDQIRAHQGYINVHSVNFPNGEIRGQLGVARPLDSDGDGRTDFSVLRFPNVAPPGVSQVQFYVSNSTAGFDTATFGDANQDFPQPGDYDGDGKADIAVYRDADDNDPNSAESHFIIYRSSDHLISYIGFGQAGDLAVQRDYDGDGITDLAVFRRGASFEDQALWFIRFSNNNPTQAVTTFWWGTTGDTTNTFDTPVPGDYDGDGKFDLAVYRVGLSPANTFIVRRSSNSSMQVQSWGNFQSDYILPGDYDGDGKFDFCAGRTGAAAASPVTWFILRSSDGGMSAPIFGRSDDIPIQGDYDGDGRTDPAMYRRGATATSQSIHHVLESFTNTARSTAWGLRADFPAATFDAR